MNLHTLKQLAKNPHYKLSDKQKAELATEDRKPMVTFGSVDKHSNKLPVHQTGQRKRRITQRRNEKK